MVRLSNIILAAFVSLGAVSASPIASPSDVELPVNPQPTPAFIKGGAGSAMWSDESPAKGACGKVSVDTDMVVGVPTNFFDDYPGYWGFPEANPLCGQTIVALYQGKAVTATVVDRNEGASEFMLNFSPAAFTKLADPTRGVIHEVMWHIL